MQSCGVPSFCLVLYLKQINHGDIDIILPCLIAGSEGKMQQIALGWEQMYHSGHEIVGYGRGFAGKAAKGR